MKKNRLRVLAICVFYHQGKILAAEGEDKLKQQRFYRPLGGAIEFGETSREALIREIREEIGAETRRLRLLGWLENIFTFNGDQGHEIVAVYDGDLADPRLYLTDGISGIEDEDSAKPFRAVWISLAEAQVPGAAPVYPDGIIDLLVKSGLK
jgi:8-oxo-dGTP pyrophosphatase MutT (NUDIX family)